MCDDYISRFKLDNCGAMVILLSLRKKPPKHTSCDFVSTHTKRKTICGHRNRCIAHEFNLLSGHINELPKKQNNGKREKNDIREIERVVSELVALRTMRHILLARSADLGA